MKDNQTDLLVQDKTSKELTLSSKKTDNKKKVIKPEEPEIEGSLLAIEKPLEHNDATILNTEAQLEEAAQENENGNTAEREEELREEAIQDGIHGVTESIKFDSEKRKAIHKNHLIKKGN